MFVCKLVPAGMRCGTFPVNTRHSCDICAASAQRFRRWSDVVRVLYVFFCFWWVGLWLCSCLHCLRHQPHTLFMLVYLPVGIRYWPGPVLVLVLCLRLWSGTGPRLDRYIELLCVAAERICGQSIWSFSQKI